MSKNEISEARLNELLEREAQLRKVQDRQRKAYQRRNARLIIFRQKAEAAGITVTDEEIDEYLAD